MSRLVEIRRFPDSIDRSQGDSVGKVPGTFLTESKKKSSRSVPDIIASYLVDYVGKFPGTFLTESTVGLGSTPIPSRRMEFMTG